MDGAADGLQSIGCDDVNVKRLAKYPDGVSRCVEHFPWRPETQEVQLYDWGWRARHKLKGEWYAQPTVSVLGEAETGERGFRIMTFRGTFRIHFRMYDKQNKTPNTQTDGLTNRRRRASKNTHRQHPIRENFQSGGTGENTSPELEVPLRCQ